MTARTESAVHVYCGPTINAAEVLDIIPGAETHPPVRHGDLLRLDVSAGDAVVIRCRLNLCLLSRWGARS
jgi:hypothetical protein